MRKTGEEILAAKTLGQAAKLARAFDPDMHATALLDHWIMHWGVSAPMTSDRRLALRPVLDTRITKGPDKVWVYRASKTGVTQRPR